jgi:hypothetical protein
VSRECIFLVGCLLCVRLPQLALTPYCVVMRPILSPLLSVNQTSLVWAGPAVIPNGLQPNLFPHVIGKGNAVELPPVVMRPMLFPKDKVNHRLPSGPAVMPIGSPLPVGVGNSVMVPTVAQAGAVLRLSRPIETSMAVSSAARCDRRPERFMYLLLCV